MNVVLAKIFFVDRASNSLDYTTQLKGSRSSNALILLCEISLHERIKTKFLHQGNYTTDPEMDTSDEYGALWPIGTFENTATGGRQRNECIIDDNNHAKLRYLLLFGDEIQQITTNIRIFYSSRKHFGSVALLTLRNG